MRPNAIESLRAAQSALAEAIAPSLISAFSQDSAQTVQMLLESLASEWDTAAEYLISDNETLRSLLSDAKDALRTAPDGNERLAGIVSQIEQRLGDDITSSVVISQLAARNDSLRATLETVLVEFEDLTGAPGGEKIDEVRAKIYQHLREVATRGWSFWDISSFRGRMASLHSGQT